MAVAVTNTELTKYGTEAVVTFNAATSTTANEVEVFTVTPTRPGSKCLMMITEAGGTAGGAVAFSIGAGTSEHFGSGAAKTGSVAANTTEAIVVNTAQHMASGTLLVTLTPATGKKLLTDSAATMQVVELPFK